MVCQMPYLENDARYALKSIRMTSSNLQLDGKVVIVTRAARGIGEAIARAFALANSSVVIADRMRRPDGRQRAEALAKEITEAGGQALVMQVDVSDRTQIERMVQNTLERFGRLTFSSITQRS